MIRKKYIFENFAYELKCVIELSVFSFFCVFTSLAIFDYVAILLLQIVVLFEFIVFRDIFDDAILNVKRVFGLLILDVGYFLVMHQYHKWEWIVLDLVFVVLISCFVWYFSDFLVCQVHMLDKRAVNLLYENETLSDENEKIMEYQERVHQVNNELNYQKIVLAKANNDLVKINNEIRSHIEVMKFFSSNFDVVLSANRLIYEIMKSKEAGLCTFYIAEDAYMNRKPDILIESKMSRAEEKINECIQDIYALVKEKGETEPLVLCSDEEMVYDFLRNTGVRDAVAFPAYSNDEIYGVLVVASNKREFFESGYSYYESLLMEFTAALRSTRLYLQMQNIARRDGLTGIYNRVYFNEMFVKLCRDIYEKQGTMSVALFDIDKFKRVNDTYGHLAGDEVIKMVAGIDAEFAETYGGIACRYGGEEFLLILPGKGQEETLPILEAMHERIRSTPVVYEEYTIDVNVSIGLAVYPETCPDIKRLLMQSDSAMYYAKRHGRGRIVVDQTYAEEEQLG
jgi:diguanylate cyclase (GGDEF)-like protein